MNVWEVSIRRWRYLSYRKEVTCRYRKSFVVEIKHYRMSMMKGTDRRLILLREGNCILEKGISVVFHALNVVCMKTHTRFNSMSVTYKAPVWKLHKCQAVQFNTGKPIMKYRNKEWIIANTVSHYKRYCLISWNYVLILKI